MLSQNVASDEIGKRAEARDTDRFAFQLADVRNRGGRKKRGLSPVVLAAHHDQISPGKIGVDHSSGSGVDDIDVPAEQRLHGCCAGADKQKLHVGTVLLV
jgi:hypothetical protein